MKATMRGASAGVFASALTFGALITAPMVASADEGGVSFWIPGFFGSLAATPQQPGFSWATIYYHTSVSAGADVAFARQVSRGGITANFNGNLTANLDADADIGFAIPTYVFATPVLGGQAAVALLVPFGRNTVSVDATLTGALGPIGFTLSGSRTDSVSGFGDLIPQFSLRWNHGVHNWMTYITGDIPVGAYEFDAAGESRHRARRDRRRRRLYLFQSGDRARILGGARLHLQLRESSPPNTRTASTCTSIGARRSS